MHFVVDNDDPIVHFELVRPLQVALVVDFPIAVVLEDIDD